MTVRRTLGLFLLCLLSFVALLSAEAPEVSLPEEFVGTIVDAGVAVPRATSARFTIHIDEYTTDEEAMELLQLLADEGPKGLEDAMRDLDKGWIRVGPSLGYPLSVARSFETENGRVIRVATDRPIQMFEVYRGLRSRDYPFGIVEIQLDAEGEGQGQLIAAAEVGFSPEGSLEIESLGTQPFRLLQVKQQQPKKKKKNKKNQ